MPIINDRQLIFIQTYLKGEIIMKSAKAIVLLACVLVPALCLGMYSTEKEPPPPVRATATRIPARTARNPLRRVKPPEDPHKDSVVMLEAFMVQARLSALYSLDVPLISKGCNSVSAEHILKLLKSTDAAQVTAGAKLAISQSSKAQTQSTARRALNISTPEKKRTEFVDVGTSLSAIAFIQPGGKMAVTLEFNHTAIEFSDGKDEIGTFVERNWSTRTYPEPGKPTLVGATQDEKTASFLIITANIKE
jgi:hypothetical protein